MPSSALLLKGSEAPIAVLEEPGVVYRLVTSVVRKPPHGEWHQFTALADASEDLDRRPIWVELDSIIAFEEMSDETVEKIENEF